MPTASRYVSAESLPKYDEVDDLRGHHAPLRSLPPETAGARAEAPLPLLFGISCRRGRRPSSFVSLGAEPAMVAIAALYLADSDMPPTRCAAARLHDDGEDE